MVEARGKHKLCRTHPVTKGRSGLESNANSSEIVHRRKLFNEESDRIKCWHINGSLQEKREPAAGRIC